MKRRVPRCPRPSEDGTIVLTLIKGLCSNFQEGRGGAKNELRKEKYYTIPPSQQGQFSRYSKYS